MNKKMSPPPPPVQPIQPPPVQTPVPPPQLGFPRIIVVLIIIATILCAGAILFFLQKKPAPNAVINPQTAEITVDTSDWKTYTNNKAGFTLKYPSSVLFNTGTKDSLQPVLSVDVQKLSDIPEELPLLMGRKDALIQKESLKTNVENTMKIGPLNAELGFSLSAPDICSVLFHRKLTFYPGDYRVTISLDGSREAIIKSMPDFFTVDQINCGSQQVWNLQKKEVFMETLETKLGKGAGQEWYDTFNGIIKTVTLTTAISPG